MRLREAIYLLALTIMLSVSFARLACSQTNSLESQSGSDCGGGPPTEVSVEMRIPPERMTAQMTLTFTRKGEALHPILAVVAFDIAVEHRDVGGLVQDLRRGGSSSLAAVVVDSERGAREVWFGKMIESGQQSAQITVELPGLIKQTKVDNYKLAFQPVEGNLKSIAGKSRAISQAKLADVRIELPEGWNVDGNNWDSDRISATELKYKGIITDNTKIEVSFKRTYLTGRSE